VPRPARWLRGVAGLFRAAGRGWWSDNALRLGAALSFYTLFAIAPMLIVAIAIAGLAFGADAARGQVVGQMQGLLGHDAAMAVQALLQGASKQRANIIATVVGTVTFLIAAITAFLELQAALNHVLHVPPPGADVKVVWLSRLRAFGVMIAIGFLLLVSLAVSAALAGLSDWIGARHLPGPLVWHAVDLILSLAIVTVLFGLLFKVLPDVTLRWRDVVLGAVVTGLLFSVGKELIGLYLGRGSVASSYGAAGSVAVLLLWVYYASQILLFGAEFVRAYAERESGKPMARVVRRGRAPG
jgi:membrane protein